MLILAVMNFTLNHLPQHYSNYELNVVVATPFLGRGIKGGE